MEDTPRRVGIPKRAIATGAKMSGIGPPDIHFQSSAITRVSQCMQRVVVYVIT